MFNEARRMGLTISAPCTKVWRGTDLAGVTSVLGDVKYEFDEQGVPLQMLVVILNGKNNELYGKWFYF